MIPNNNLSVLPFYSSIEQQNARKWWVYGRIYPLFTPSKRILPFQILRTHRTEETYHLVDSLTQFAGTMSLNNYWYATEFAMSGYVDVTSYRGMTVIMEEQNGLLQYAFVKNTPVSGQAVQFATGSSNIRTDSDVTVTIPDDAVYLWVLMSTENPHTVFTPVTIDVYANIYISRFEVYNKNGQLVGDYTNTIRDYITTKFFTDYDVLVYRGATDIFTFANGQYYAVISDGVETWYSEVFTVVIDLEPYLKIEWWDVENFVMDAGTIIYKNPSYKNVIYLDSALAKPEYIFEEEGENRDGYFFPIKQISEKKYKFKFFASEYILDVMRLIRMADYARITYHGQTYNLDTFLLTPEWESNGDVASVEAEFDTATVAKKLPTII